MEGNTQLISYSSRELATISCFARPYIIPRRVQEAQDASCHLDYLRRTYC